jgi:hypothetical protein
VITPAFTVIHHSCLASLKLSFLQVWQKHKENLILMERYHYFASSCRQFGFGVRSLSESMQDERESDGALATVLDVLKRIHTIFFDTLCCLHRIPLSFCLSIPHSNLNLVSINFFLV